MPNKMFGCLVSGQSRASVRSAGSLAVIVLASQVAGCSSNADDDAIRAKLVQAEAKILVLESELESLKKQPTPPVAVAMTSVAATSETSAGSAPAAAAPAPDAPAGQQWTYSLNEEQMTGGMRKTASVTSSNSVEFGFPYGGAQNGRLTLRTDPRYGKDVIFRIERGQILCISYEGCTVQVRFDDEKPLNFSASAAADHSSETVFIDDYARFLAKMRKAKRVRLSLSIYQNGRPVFDFDVSGFDVEKYQAKKS